MMYPQIGRFHGDFGGTGAQYPETGDGDATGVVGDAHWRTLATAGGLPNGHDVLIEAIEWLAGPTAAAAAETVTVTALTGSMAMDFKTPYMPGVSTTTDRMQEVGKVFRGGFNTLSSGAVAAYRIYYRIIRLGGNAG